MKIISVNWRTIFQLQSLFLAIRFVFACFHFNKMKGKFDMKMEIGYGLKKDGSRGGISNIKIDGWRIFFCNIRL
jgi:hypothetical protein